MSLHSKASALFRNLGVLTLLTLALPFNAAIVGIALLYSRIRSLAEPPKPSSQTSQTILITGGKMTKALQLARSFANAGHRVILVETHKYWLSGHRFSNAVDRFYTVPDPAQDPEAYTQALQRLVEQEQVDTFIPVSSPVASYYDAIAGQQLPSHCQVLHFTPEVTQTLDNKYMLCEQARVLGLSAPKAYLINDPQQILSFDFEADGSEYILKSIRYDSVSRLDLTKLPCSDMETYVERLPISKENPWIMQEFIRGQEYCTHSTVRNGQIRLHCCAKSSPFQVNYESIEKPEIYAWVSKFVAGMNLTGQISFDLIQTEDGAVYPIECNPRTHSAITMFYDHPGVADAYLKDSQHDQETPIFPLPNSQPTYWIYQELWRLTGIRSWEQLQAWITKINQGTDGILQVSDPLPFLMVHHWQIPLLLLGNLQKLKGWMRIDFNIGKLVESGGD
ncbi:MAG: ATP-grasp enzyme [Symploca sp. SIO2E6]|nr:ATP-grasp enzyme [Symploca sp. SIO2E6]